MNLSWIDWAMMAVAVMALRFVSLSTRRHMKGVADFLSANRCAGRYLLTIAGAMANTGAISIVGMFELYYRAGFPPVWWTFMSIIVAPIALLTGWVYYRFRETRALTMAQFLEMRYNRRFRIFAGILCFTSGVLNFGIFPAVAARFIIYFCGLPEYFYIPGTDLPISTFAAVMLVDLGLALTFVNMGGQISVMVTECFQGIISGFVFITVSIFVLLLVKWPQIVSALGSAPSDASMLHPFHTSQVKDFNPSYFIIGFFSAFYSYMSWQGAQGFNSAGRNPHEQRMGGLLGLWRAIPLQLMILLLPVAAFTVLHLPEFSAKAAAINESLGRIGNENIREQMRVPVALAHMLPVGIKGLLAMVMLFFSFTCHDTYMHSWGSIFVQDVYMPIRRRPLEAGQHIRVLRWSIVGVAAFAFLFSLLYRPSELILLFLVITGVIWTGGSGAVIIGGLYWSRGTTAGAYAALTVGAVTGMGGLIVQNIWKNLYHQDFPINAMWLLAIASVVAILAYVVVSLLSGRKEDRFNIERMLHRGKYAVESDKLGETGTLRSRWLEIVGIRREFSLGDKIVAIAVVVWNFGWFAAFLVVSALNFVFHIGTEWWARFWHFYVWLQLIVGLPTTIWITVGGVIDIKGLFRALATAVRDPTDDGRVVLQPEDSDREACGVPETVHAPLQSALEARDEEV